MPKNVQIPHNCTHLICCASLVAQRLKRLPAMQETWVRSLGWEDPLEKEMATHSSIPAWRIPWMEEPGGLQSTGSQRVRHDWVISLSFSFTRYQSNAKNSPIQVSTVHELWTFRCSSWILKRQRNQRSNWQHLLDHGKSKRVPENLYWLCKILWLCGSQQTGKCFKRWEYQTTWPASWEICM